jgi:hypothetical protein
VQQAGAAVGDDDRVVVLEDADDARISSLLDDWDVNARTSAYLPTIARSFSRSRMVAEVSSRTLSERVPRSGLPSTAMTRSPRSEARVAPSPTVTVVLPTPPLRLSTATRW